MTFLAFLGLSIENGGFTATDITLCLFLITLKELSSFGMGPE